MKFFGFGVSAIAAVVLAGGAAFAGDNGEISAMKATMDSMKQEMEAMRATMASEREAIRASAGGAPEAMKTKSGKATIKIGGDVRIRYALGFESGYNPNDVSDMTRYTNGDWALRQVKLTFNIDMTPDTSGYIALRLDRTSAGPGNLLDEAWYQWKNIGGTGFAAKVGLHTLDLGMYNGDNSPWGRVMVWDPFVKDTQQSGVWSDRATRVTNIANGTGGYQSSLNMRSLYQTTDITNLGVSVTYKWDQFKMVAGVYDGQNGVVTDGSVRNYGLSNHFVTGYYDPCWLEGLHLQASYFGEFDLGQGATNLGNWRNTVAPNAANRRGTGYTPGFDMGIFYKAGSWAAYGEMVVVANPNFYADSSEITFSVGADYSLTEKLRIGGAFDYKSANISNSDTNVIANTINQWAMRASLGANYDFGNGLYIRAQYSHDWMKTYGINASQNRDNDMIAFQTGFKF